jgi:hypothetical protein
MGERFSFSAGNALAVVISSLASYQRSSAVPLFCNHQRFLVGRRTDAKVLAAEFVSGG